jgi:acyl-CoA thioester hydrolase
MSQTEFRFPIRVYYEDTDAAGIVYHANYIKFMERARTEWLRALGFDQRAIAREHGIAFVVRSANVEFLRPARFNDQLFATCALQRLGWASVGFRQTVIDEHGTLLSTGDIRVGSVNFHRMQPQRMPEAIYQGISNGR